jgi:hypothetical protein
LACGLGWKFSVAERLLNSIFKSQTSSNLLAKIEKNSYGSITYNSHTGTFRKKALLAHKYPFHNRIFTSLNHASGFKLECMIIFCDTDKNDDNR